MSDPSPTSAKRPASPLSPETSSANKRAKEDPESGAVESSENGSSTGVKKEAEGTDTKDVTESGASKPISATEGKESGAGKMEDVNMEG